MNRSFRHFDWLLLLCTFALVSYGVAMIYSTAPIQGNLTDEFYFRQIVYVLIGFVALFVLALIDYRLWELYPLVPYVVGVGILALVTASGSSQFSAQRWLNLGFLPVQPSELAKIL